ncbi:MAG: hypothetical protein ACJAVN_000601, partial [Roseivirga sp.]
NNCYFILRHIGKIGIIKGVRNEKLHQLIQKLYGLQRTDG